MKRIPGYKQRVKRATKVRALDSFKKISDWGTLKDQHEYLTEEIAPELNYKTIDDFYKLTVTVLERNGGSGLLSRYNRSPLLLLRSVFCHFEWDPTLFSQVPRGYWDDLDNQKQYLGSTIARFLEVKTLSDFKNILPEDIEDVGSAFFRQYNHSLYRALANLYPFEDWSTISPENTRSSDAPELMLAKVWDGVKDVTGWWVSEKYDGVRAYWDGKSLVSRCGKKLSSPDWFTETLPNDHLDGELYGGPGKFYSTSNIVMNRRSDLWSCIEYKVFDCPKADLLFEHRMKYLKQVLEPCDSHITMSNAERNRKERRRRFNAEQTKNTIRYWSYT